ncbi:MAG: hypothetical protein M3N98_07575, partial [Actinomycetota bacterium]|nr:hypothetical protein [Actinomycetota bacterium]
TDLTDIDLAGLGMPHGVVADFKKFVKGYGLIVDVRPTNPEALLRLQSGEALPKPEVLKQKTINDLDVLLGIDPKHVGLVGHIDPAILVVPPEGSVVKHPLTNEDITVDKALHKRLSERLKRRATEFDPKGPIAEKMKKLIASGDFSIEPPGIIKFGEGANAKPFTGDHDIFNFFRVDGRPLTPQEYHYIVQQMREWGMNVEHGAHLHWITDDPEKLNIAKKHAPGGSEPLIRFGGGDEVREVHWDGDLHAQEKLGPSSDVITPGGEFAAPGRAEHAGRRPMPPAEIDPAVAGAYDPVADEFLRAPVDFNREAPAPASDAAGNRIPDVVEHGRTTVDVSDPSRYRSSEDFGDVSGDNRIARYRFGADLDEHGTMSMDVFLRRGEESAPSGAARSSMRGKEQFDAAFEHLNATPPGVRRIHSDFGDGDNLAAIGAKYEKLMSEKVLPEEVQAHEAKARIEAAKTTISAMWAESKGFVDVVVNLEMEGGRVVGAAVDYYPKGQAPPQTED